MCILANLACSNIPGVTHYKMTLGTLKVVEIEMSKNLHCYAKPFSNYNIIQFRIKDFNFYKKKSWMTGRKNFLFLSFSHAHER